MSQQQAPRHKVNKNIWLKACPREGCGGDVGRFKTYGPDEFKCLMCSREVPYRVLNR